MSVSGSVDPLMTADFDSVRYLNSVFPDEASLSGLDTFLLGVSSQIGVLEDEISLSVQTQSLAGQEASKQVRSAQTHITALFLKMADIGHKAAHSEKMVQEICADIKKLDIAKTHLQTSITSLKRLQMLITAVGQLELLAQDLHYKEAANLLDAVRQLLSAFDHAAYHSIPIIAEIRERVLVLQTHLKKHAHRAFREIGQLVDSVAAPAAQDAGMLTNTGGGGGGDSGNPFASSSSGGGGGGGGGGFRAFSDACLVVDCLGLSARRELLDELVQLQLVPYDKLFAADPPMQHCTLEEVERRWAWFKRLLRNVDTKFANICPAHWHLPLRLCLEFTERTKGHLVTLLTRLDVGNNIDVHALLKALQSTLRFEQDMSARFAAPPAAAAPSSSSAAAAAAAALPSGSAALASGAVTVGATAGSHAALGTSRDRSSSTAKFYSHSPTHSKHTALDGERLRQKGQVMYIPTDHSTSSDEQESGFLRLARETVCGGEKGISGIFDRFLGCYVLLERQNLEDMLQRLSQEEDVASSSASSSTSSADGGTMTSEDDGGGGGGSSKTSSGGQHVLGSSMNMFVFIKNSIKRCTVFSRGSTFLALANELRDCLQRYAGLLHKRCPAQERVASLYPPGTTGVGVGAGVGGGGAWGTTVQAHPLPLGAERGLCYLINTGEYCAEVVPQLEALVKAKISPELVSQVDFSAGVDQFMDLVAHALKVLVSGTMHRLGDAFRAMSAANWATVTQVSEESDYVRRLSAVLLELLPAVRVSLGQGYFNTYCTKLAAAVSDLYLEIVMRQPRISEAGTQQLLLDVYNVKSLLAQLHSLGEARDRDRDRDRGRDAEAGAGAGTGAGAGAAAKAKAPPVFAKLVATRMAHIETVLKLVGTPEEHGMLLERFKIMWPEGKAADLQAVMALKGLSRATQVALLEAFGLTAAAAASFHQQTSDAGAGAGAGAGTGAGAAADTFAAFGAGAKMMRRYGSELSGSMKKLGLGS